MENYHPKSVFFGILLKGYTSDIYGFQYPSRISMWLVIRTSSKQWSLMKAWVTWLVGKTLHENYTMWQFKNVILRNKTTVCIRNVELCKLLNLVTK